MKTIKTNSKAFNEKAFAYILDAIDGENYDREFSNDTDKLQFLADTFKSEYGHPTNLKYHKTWQNTLANWFMGLPSAISIEFRNHSILELAVKWGSLSESATEKEQDKVIANWFNLMAFKTLQLMRKHNIVIA